MLPKSLNIKNIIKTGLYSLTRTHQSSDTQSYYNYSKCQTLHYNVLVLVGWYTGNHRNNNLIQYLFIREINRITFINFAIVEICTKIKNPSNTY